MPWDDTPQHGWPADPWLPFPPDADRVNVAREREDAGSMLHLYRRLLRARRASDALRAGDLALVEPAVLAPSVVGWERRAGDDVRIILVNFEADEARAVAGRGRTIEVASDGMGEGLAFDGTLGPDQAVVLR
jgi:alpha-glucosidase